MKNVITQFIVIFAVNTSIASNTMISPTTPDEMQISAGGDYTCVLDANGVKCWGSDEYHNVSGIPKLTNPKMISAGGAHTNRMITKWVQEKLLEKRGLGKATEYKAEEKAITQLQKILGERYV